ncbi:hypothetical protein RUM43_003118 [Polyplax serrata]|uniref:FLYWCH-type domain-containing protein n=1 Tax=Polyplax serrata TaxID=468196 RepID=A0AAN8S9C0_POLSC
MFSSHFITNKALYYVSGGDQFTCSSKQSEIFWLTEKKFFFIVSKTCRKTRDMNMCKGDILGVLINPQCYLSELISEQVELIRREDSLLGKTTRGGRKVIFRTYEYNLNVFMYPKSKRKTFYWKCSTFAKTRCKARITVSPNGITNLTGHHKHGPPALNGN